VPCPEPLTCAKKFRGSGGAGKGRKAMDPMEIRDDDQSRKSAKSDFAFVYLDVDDPHIAWLA
jgi:hypothetical protein